MVDVRKAKEEALRNAPTPTEIIASRFEACYCRLLNGEDLTDKDIRWLERIGGNYPLEF